MAEQPTLIDYYQSIIPDLNALQAIVNQPLPQTFWVNALKVTTSRLQALLTADGFAVSPLAWNPQAFYSTGDSALGYSWQFLTGLIQIQEEVSMLPVTLLDPQPGERVLDMCSAPGGKTAQMAVAMQNTGTIVANDRNYGRMRALAQIMKRLGLINISMTIYDGRRFPKLENYFDKVLVDVPCSCEGTFRKNSQRVVVPNRQRSLNISQVQREILLKAIQAARPGGKIVYSTCTFAPEENERVINEVLTNYPGCVRILPIELANFDWSEGLTHWSGENFSEELKQTMRVWPHQNNSGGFYVAVLEKLGAAPIATAQSDNSAKPAADIQAYLDDLQDRFDFADDILKQYRYSFASSKGFYFANRDSFLPPGLKADATGLLFMKTRISHPKLVTSPAMMLAPYARKNIIHLTQPQCEAYFKLQDIAVTEEQVSLCTDTGYVLVFYNEIPLGTAIYFANPGKLYLRSLFPKYLRGLQKAEASFN